MRDESKPVKTEGPLSPRLLLVILVLTEQQRKKTFLFFLSDLWYAGKNNKMIFNIVGVHVMNCVR